jgi:O-antigen/teichoic acid export membrane protein
MMLPLITVPYVSRVLKPEGVGIFAYTNSIVQYFILFGMLGIGIYGNKRVAMTRDNKEKLSKTFYSIYYLQLMLTCISLVVYLVFVTFFFHEYKIIAFIQVIALLASVVNCSWLFSGLEQFQKIVTRNVIVKVSGLIAVFIFVKSPDDLVLYIIIMGLSTFIGEMVMWLYVKKYVVFVRIRLKDIFEHFKPTLIYFLPEVAVQVYFVLDKTMLGIFSGSSEVGIYDYADKILKIALAVVTSLGTVMLPRMSNIFAKGDLEKANVYITKSLEFSTLIAIPMMFGIAGISNEFIPWFLGEEFSRSASVLLIISPAIFLMAWSGVFGAQYLVPLGKMKEYTISLYIGAVVNLILNLILIRPYGAIGAAVGTLCAEFAVTLVQILFIRSHINIKKVLPKSFYYLIAGIIMFGILRLIGGVMGVSILTTIIQVIMGIITYIAIVIIFELFMKDKLILNEINNLLSRIRR